MPQPTTIFNNNKLFLIISSIIFILLFVISQTNGRFIPVDFEVYYYAAKSFLAGEQVYGNAFGNSEVGFFKYAPFTLLLYTPASLLPFQLAAILNYFFLSAIAISAILLRACSKITSGFYKHLLHIVNVPSFAVYTISVYRMTGRH